MANWGLPRPKKVELLNDGDNREALSSIDILNTQYELRFIFHQIDEIVEEVARIVWAGGGFGVVLDGKGFLALAKDSLVRVVVEVQVRQFDVLIRKRVHIDAEAVVLAGDFDLAGLEILDGVVGAAVAKLELVSLGAEGESENLVAEADAEDRDFAEQLFDGFDGVLDRGRVAWAVA